MYMSCCPVAIIGNSHAQPQGPPLFIANLQANEQDEPMKVTFYVDCHVPADTSIIFQAEVMQCIEVDRAPIARNLVSLPVNPQVCSSANQNIRERLMVPNLG